MKSKTIYLAGGFKSGWQDRVIYKLPNAVFFDPRSHNLENPEEYTKWDLDAIRESDIVIAYMEKTNPGGYALSLEIGYAKALNKHVILIDEHEDTQRQRYFDMIRVVSDECFESFDDFVDNINSIIEIPIIENSN